MVTVREAAVLPVFQIIPVEGLDVNTTELPAHIPAEPVKVTVGVVTGFVVMVEVTGAVFEQPNEFVAVKLTVEVVVTETEAGVNETGEPVAELNAPEPAAHV